MTSLKSLTSVLVTTAVLSVPAIGSLQMPLLKVNSLGSGTAALANGSPQKVKGGLRYIPPKLPARGGLQRSQGAGSRGTEGDVLVTLLTPSPQQAIGQTISGHPTFYWNVSFPPDPKKPQVKPTFPVTLDFTLVRRGVPQPLVYQRIQVNQLGVVKLEMPKNLPQLELGTEYRWTVSIVKDPIRRSMNPTFQSFITRVPLTPELNQKLKATTSDRDRAAIYAEAGLWYDALNAIGASYLSKPNDPAIRADFFSLLDQVGLPKIANQRL